MCCLPVVCCMPLLFPLRFYYFLTRIGQFPPTTGRLTCLWHCCSRCESCHYSSDFSRPSFFKRKVQDFGVPKLIFNPRAFAFVALGTRLPLVSARGPLFRRAETTSWGGLGPPKFFGTRAEKFPFTRQKSSGPCPIWLARVPKFRSAVPKMKVV